MVASLAGYDSVNFFYKGLIWLLLAIVAEVPTSVRLVITLATFLFAHSYFMSQTLMILNLNGKFHSFQFTVTNTGVDWAPFILITSVSQPCTSLFSTSGRKVGLFPYALLQQMPQTPTMIIVTIAATRIYRSLISFGPSEMYGVPTYHFYDCD